MPVLTAYENAEMVLSLQGVDEALRRERVLQLLAEVGLEGLEDRRPDELSGGQQQRVAIVRAIAADPAIVLADEPTANVDSATAEHLLGIMEELNRKRGVTLRVFPRELSLSENWPGSPNGSPSDHPAAGSAPVPTRALLERLARLRLIAEAPGPRARRLAFHMARTRPSVMLPPRHGVGVPNRWGVEASALYTAMGQGIVTASRSRPPPLPPPRVPRPIITLL